MAALLAGSGPVLAQSNPFRPVLYINESVVTQFDIDQRARFMELVHAPETGRAAAEKAVVEDRLRMIAAKQLGIKPTDAAIEAALSEFAGRGNLTLEQFNRLLTQSGIDPAIFRDFIVSGVAWRDVVRQRIVPQIRVSDAEIDQEFKKIVTTPKVTDVLVSEMIIPVAEGQEQRAHDDISRLAASISSESDFAAAARQYSATRSAEQGGRLPWTSLSNLPPSLRPILLSMQPGQVSQPLSVPGAIVLFYLRDTRGTVRAGAQDQVLDYLRLRLGNPTEASRIAQEARDCSDVYQAANGLPADRLIAQKGPVGSIPADAALVLAGLDDNEATAYGGDVIMLCKRAPALLAEMDDQPAVPVAPSSPDAPEGAETSDAAPARGEVRDIVFNRKISAAADAYLAELRADAVVRRP
ncbi:peptidylprolyl isomerase [Paracoccus sp. (in: a-proteobacteria)]|uniref:peptidylprolyl isomerase n=1 Tax=Paracoccus sp. TaxID=267 RepID=UPI00289DBE6F|nr:peptidylprolyl isomerase [Paracoccus sp. (in: a-proteobacteria)]